MNYKNTIKIILYLFLTLIPMPGIAISVDYNIPDSLQNLIFLNSGPGSIVKLAALKCPPLGSLVVIPESGVVDSLDVYHIRMTLSDGGIPRGGGIALSFLSTFGLNNIRTID
ncbi:MAG: hypothetical protein NTV06_09420, partial [candidate division Zixibacteria bacterium]|nr:hypothetical protein [candidate division Zixibacteria bacterium]